MSAGTGRRTLAVGWRVALVAALLGGLSLAAVDPTLGPQYGPYAAVGGFLAIRRPRNIIGWLLIGIGVAFIGTTTPPGFDVERLAIAAVVTRFRRGDEVERLQIRWLGAAIAICALGAIGAAIESSIRPDDGPLATTLVLYGGILAIPISIGVAVLRYRLFDLDRIISRTIAYGLISGLLLGAYALLILALQGPLGQVTGGETVSVAVSTLIVAALFQPVRRRVQRAVDHRFHRAAFDAEQTVVGFAGRLRGEVDLATLQTDLRGTVHDAIRPAQLGLWLRASRQGVAATPDRREP